MPEPGSSGERGRSWYETGQTCEEPPNRPLRVNEFVARPLRLCCHSSICFCFISASFLAYSSGISFPWYTPRIGLTSGGLKIPMAIVNY